MAEIISDGKPQSPFKSLVDSFNSLDKFLKLQVLTIALIIVATPVIVSGYLVFNPQASELNPEQEVTGTLEVAHADNFDTQTATYEYSIKTDSGKKVKIRNISKDKAIRNAGARVRIKGKKIRVNKDQNVLGESTGPDGTVAEQQAQQTTDSPTPETAADQLPLAAAPITDPSIALDTTSIETLAPPPAAPQQKKIAVILFNFTNDTRQTYTPEQIASMMFNAPGSVKNFFEEESRGKVQVTGDVLGWYTLPTTNTGCSWSSWDDMADSAARAAGVDLSSYTHFMYFWPGASCGWAGLGYVNGPRSYINGNNGLRVMAHELGHNFGVIHASSYTCNDSSGNAVALSNSCTFSEYGDPFDVMGAAANPVLHSHGEFIGEFGWLNPGEVQTVTTNGTYTINPLLIQPFGNTKLLQIPRGNGQYLYIDYRATYGVFDNFPWFGLNLQSGANTGVIIRVSPDTPDRSGSGRSNSFLVDATPNSTRCIENNGCNWPVGFTDAYLQPGKSVYDPVSRVTITTMSVTKDISATVKIEFATPPPPTTTPTIGGATPTPTSIVTPTVTPTRTPTPTVRPTNTPTPTVAPTNIPTPTPGGGGGTGGTKSFVKTIGSISISKSGNTTMVMPAASVSTGRRVIIASSVGTFAGTVACKDSKGNIYTIDGRLTSNNLFICSGNIVNALTSTDTITITYPGFSGTSTAVANEFSGITSIDGSSKQGSSTSTKTVSTQSLTTTNPNDIIFSLVSSKYPFTPSNGFTLITSFNGLSTNYRTTTQTGTFSTIGSVSTGSSWGAVSVGYR